MAAGSLKRMAARARLSSPTSVPLAAFQPQRELCLELKDNHQVQYSAIDFFGVRTRYRDPAPVAARLAEQFEQQNRALLSLMDVQIGRNYDGSNVLLNIEAGNTVGAIPLFSPTSAVPDYGLTIQPRFPWVGIGPMLAEMGWRVVPVPLKLPLLRRSERKIPGWVLSSMILNRLRALLDALTRRFEIVSEHLRAPRGSVHSVRVCSPESLAGTVSQGSLYFPGFAGR